MPISAKRAVVHSEELPWVDSPLPGVQRRMLERDGEEVARATSVVRYAPDSSFSPHSHGGGEEFLVLDGVFSDEHGDFGPGMLRAQPAGLAAHAAQRAGLHDLRQAAPDGPGRPRDGEDRYHARALAAGPGRGRERLPLYERGASGSRW